MARPFDTMPEGFPDAPVFVGKPNSLVRGMIADAHDCGAGQRAIARHFNLSIWIVRRILKRNGKLRGADLIWLGRKPGR